MAFFLIPSAWQSFRHLENEIIPLMQFRARVSEIVSKPPSRDLVSSGRFTYVFQTNGRRVSYYFRTHDQNPKLERGFNAFLEYPFDLRIDADNDLQGKIGFWMWNALWGVDHSSQASFIEDFAQCLERMAYKDFRRG